MVSLQQSTAEMMVNLEMNKCYVECREAPKKQQCSKLDFETWIQAMSLMIPSPSTKNAV